ncbi:hypothetical protein [Nonomuraea roseola]|uniref:Uncharacterized protein n=1 Tax=Nonomuraea roseola TaxID=46179 RepID=A0ABV5PYY8_9ACTN
MEKETRRRGLFWDVQEGLATATARIQTVRGEGRRRPEGQPDSCGGERFATSGSS